MPAVKFTASTVVNYSPRKTRLVIDPIRGTRLTDALLQLKFNKRPKSKKIYDLLLSAASNLKLTEEEKSSFKVSTIVAEEAQRLYRMIPRSRGSAHRIARRYSRVKVILEPLK
jgi:large subunit ribosomal protein L22